MFPDLPIMIRPNGYKPIERVTALPASMPRDASSLRIAHFGILSPARIDPVPFIVDLQRSGRWQSIVFCQFGDDFGVGLDRVPLDVVRIERHPPQSWEEVVERAPEFDTALVVAYPLPALLPSKAVEYSTLPLPRIALTNPDPDDALREYVQNHQGWLALSHGEPDIGRRVWEHVQRPWSPTELAPSAEDAWPEVTAQIAEFLTTCVNHADVAPVDR
jgi:hypothetical protein